MKDAPLADASSAPRRYGTQRYGTRPEPEDTVRISTTAPAQWHRGMTLIATISLFIGTRAAWTDAMQSQPAIGGIITICYAGILFGAVLALVVRTRRAVTRVDAGVLVLAVTLVLCHFWLDHSGSDEGVLTAKAAEQILHGHHVYGQEWPWLFGGPRVGVTKTMSGSADYAYGYPPLTALLAAPVHLFVHSPAAATAVTTAALLAGTVTLWVQLPPPWRSAATAVCLGFGLLPGYARDGYPAVVALALLVPVVVGWHDTGAGGRLGRRGTVRALFLGAACAAQQLAWFLAPFLLAGIYAVRRGELGPRAARRVAARYVGAAVLPWASVNGYFAIQDFRDWGHGLLLPLTQKAILHGQGIMGISYYFTGGSSRLDYYSYASVLLFVGLLAATVLFVRRLGAALTVLPFTSFYLATRSEDGYFLMMAPLWLAAAATVPGSALAGAWQPRLHGLVVGRAKVALAGALLAPAVLCAGVAAASPPPLRMSLAPRFATRTDRSVASVVLRVANRTGFPLAPHFASRTGQGASNWWTITSGPAGLRPHATATYVVRPPGGQRTLPGGSNPRIYLIAVTGSPMTITTVRIPVPAGVR